MKKLLLILLAAVLTCTSMQLQAQCNAPVVNTFSPNTGFIGSTVVINGANFDAIPANNQVFFGATQATVVAASFGQLTVTVPTGATYGPISVKNACGLIGSSSYAFNGIFCGTIVNSTTYATLSYSINVSGGYQMLSQDMDLDGKPDVLVCGFTSNKVSIMLNKSTPGNFLFAPKFDLSFSGATRCIAPADYDGDGKIDLAVVDNGINGVRIYRNTSVPGTLSFASTSIVISGIGGYQCAAGDLNNDGKLDLAVGSGSNVTTLRNTSTPGNISFANNTTFSVGGFATGVVITDVDGDGVKDIGAANAGGNTLHAVRNTTAPGASTFSFAALQTFPTGAYPYRLFLGDFDKDGKIDFVDNDFSGGTVSIFRNTSTVGNISFASKVTLTARSSNYRLGVGDADGDGKPDIVAKSSGENFFSVLINTSPAPGTITFNSKLDFTDPAEVSGIVIADLDGDFVPDISTSGINSNALKIFRNNASVIDNTPPTAICKNIIVPLSPAGTATVTAAMIDNGSSDACGIGSILINDAASVSFNCTNIGANTVTLKVIDRKGNTSTCTATVTVAPAAIIVAGQTTVCQGQTVLLTANLGDTYQWQKDGVDIGGATSQTYTATASGNYTVTVTNAGGCSGTSAGTQITVNDNPTVSTTPSGNASLCLPANNVVLSASTSSIYQWKKEGVNIPGATQQNYTATAAGTYSVQVIDLFGCSATSSPIVVSATDNVPPTAICKNVTLVINSGGTAGITVADINNGSFDNCGPVTVSISNGPTNFTCADAGQTFAVTLLVTDSQGNTSSCIAQVSVTDPNTVCNQAPVAVCKPLVLSADANCQAVVSAADFNGGSTDADGDVLTFSVSPAGPYAIGTTTVTLTVTDPKGASSTCTTTVTVADNTAPVAQCKSATVTLSGGSATIAVSDVNNGSTDNCGIASMVLSKTTFTCANIGANTVTLTVTDIYGNVSTCDATVTVLGEVPSCSIASVPTDNTYTGGVSTNLYLGYGAQSTKLSVTTPASGAPYTYVWSGPTSLLSSTSSSAPVFTPVAAGSYTFTVLVTNQYGCTTSCTITICVTDIRVPGTGGKKVYVCHVPPGNPGNAHTLSISVNAVPAHLGNHGGDRLGTCDQKPCSPVVAPNAITQTNASQVTKEVQPVTEETFSVVVSPNPSANYFTLKLTSRLSAPISMKVMDANGRMMDTKAGLGANSTVQVGHNYSTGTYYAEMIQGTTRKVVQLIKANK